jgi:hypothetical protein
MNLAASLVFKSALYAAYLSGMDPIQGAYFAVFAVDMWIDYMQSEMSRWNT